MADMTNSLDPSDNPWWIAIYNINGISGEMMVLMILMETMIWKVMNGIDDSYDGMS